MRKTQLNMATPKPEQMKARNDLLAEVTSLNARLGQIKEEIEVCVDHALLCDLLEEESKLKAERSVKLSLSRAVETAVEEEYLTADEGEGSMYPELPATREPRSFPKCSPKVTVQFKEKIELRKLDQEHRLEKHFREVEETFIEAGVGARFQREFVPSDDFRRIALRKLVESLPPKMRETAQLFLDENQSEWIDLKQHLIKIYMSKGRLNSVLEKKIAELQFPGHALVAVFIAEGRSILNLFKVIEAKGPGEDLKGRRDILERILSKCPESYRKAAVAALKRNKVDLEYGGLEDIDIWEVIAEHGLEAETFERMEPTPVKRAAPKTTSSAARVDPDFVGALYDVDNQPVRASSLRQEFPFLYGIFGTRRSVSSLSADIFDAVKMIRGEAKSGAYVVMCFVEDPGLDVISAKAKEYGCNARVFAELTQGSRKPDVPKTVNFH